MTVVPGHWPTVATRDPATIAVTEMTRERLDEEIVRLESMRDATVDDNARPETDFVLSRLEQVKLSF
jgi:hypothetical protein